MSIKKRTTGAVSAAATVGLGASYGIVHLVEVLSSADTSVSVAIVDSDSRTIATIASSDYTTKTQFYLSPVEATVFDSAGEVMAANGDASVGVLAHSPLTITPSGVGSGTVTVDVFVEV